MNEQEAVEALTRLGLTTYEARVFVALQKLGTGTASDVAEVTDVPRSQVYGAADDLESRELLEVQETRPTVYRPVSPEAAERRLLAQLESTGQAAFDYLDQVRGSFEDEDEESEALWTVRGTESIHDRTVQLIGAAEQTIIYALENPEHLTEPVLDALSAAADCGVAVTVVSENDAVLSKVRDDAVETISQPGDHLPDVSTARLLLVDDDTILLSVLAPDSEGEREIAFWSDGTAFARALTRLSAELFATDCFD